ncbi:MAG: HD domain-containing protein [candidate division WOR-3 bacterium]|nr:HD domain-containing protein [candidate division WOR-3 bacterium]MCX7947851.1 HD domain-containing protein [candidate division WOR-3 bacterium]MDW8150673.1 HD domain-containing protein [candidate division WOR-3 bacterium]
MKFIRDPLYEDFIVIDGLLLKVLEHYSFQRLRRISQLGLVSYVYPGATHTRFSHSLGAMHLMDEVIKNLEMKGFSFTKELKLAMKFCALVHDIGHCSFSHALEFTLLDINHEEITKIIIQEILKDIVGIEIAEISIEILNHKFNMKFVNELISSQLDVDRLDYIRRDAFYCGVDYGLIDVSRILRTLTIHNNKLVVEEKGKHAVEGYLVARYLMYWSVYFHKTNLAIQAMLYSLFKRARDLVENKIEIPLIDSLKILIEHGINTKLGLNAFLTLDDSDIFYVLKLWTSSNDKILSDLSRRILNREIFKTYEELSIEEIDVMRKKLINEGLDPNYYLIERSVSDVAYELNDLDTSIKVLSKNNELLEISQALPTDTLRALSRPIKKKLIFSPLKF